MPLMLAQLGNSFGKMSWMLYLRIAGDFNMIEDHLDQVGDNSVTIHGQELAIWEQLQLVDAWHAPSVRHI